MSTIFISHSTVDNEAVKQLKQRLERWEHHSVFLDLDPETGIQAGQSWERTLYRKLRACRAVIAWVTEDYLTSYWCFAEIALARMEGKHIFAILDPSVSIDKLPSILTEKQAIQLQFGEDQAYARLKSGLKDLDILGKVDWNPDESPYLGLSYYEEKHAPVFFGREEEIQAGLELLNRGAPNLVMVLGASGSGKSSLTRAGILPRLRKNRDQFLVVDPFRPRTDPFRELANVLEKAAKRYAPEISDRFEDESLHERLGAKIEIVETEDGETTVEITEEKSTTENDGHDRLKRLILELEELTENPPGPATDYEFLNWTLNDLRRVINSNTGETRREKATRLMDLVDQLLRASEHRNARLVLIIDQFEELLGYAEEGMSHPANRFLKMLRTTLEMPDCPILVVGTMRSDFLSAFQRNSDLQGIDFESLSVGPMNQKGMRNIIEEPARLSTIELESGLADLLLEDTETPDALPLLSFTLWVLWRDYRDDGVLDLNEYKDLGGLDGAIAREADALLRIAEREGKVDELRTAFINMARLSDEGTYARQPVDWDSEKLKPVHDILKEFIERRLLVSRERIVEVAHEALFRSWPPLKKWLDDNRSEILLRQQIKTEAKAWGEAKRASDRLWRGGRLQQAVELKKQEILPKVEAEFIDAAQRRRYIKHAVWIASVIGAFAVLVFFIAKTEEDRRRTIERLSSVVDEQLKLGHRREALTNMAWLLSEKGVTGKSLLAPEERVSTTYKIAHNSSFSQPLYHGGVVTDATFSPEGDLVATTDSAGGVKLWHTISGEQIGGEDIELRSIVPGKEKNPVTVSRVVFHPKERMMLTTSYNSQVNLWSTETAASLSPPLRHNYKAVERASFSNSGAFAVTSAKWVKESDKTLLAVPFKKSNLAEICIWDFSASLPKKRAFTIYNDFTGLDISDYRFTKWALSSDEKKIVTADTRGVIQVWPIRFDGSTESTPLYEYLHSSPVHHLHLCLNDSHLVFADETNTIWTLLNHSEEGRLDSPLEVGSHKGLINQLAVRSKVPGKVDRVFSTGEDKTARVFEISSNNMAPQTIEVIRLKSPGTSITSTSGSISSLDKEFLLIGERSGVTSIWDLSDGSEVEPRLRHSKRISALALSPDGKKCVTGSSDGTARIWEMEAFVDSDNLYSESIGSVGEMKFSNSSQLIALVRRDGSTRLHHKTERKEPGDASASIAFDWKSKATIPGEVSSIAFSPARDSDFVTADRSGEVQFWNYNIGTNSLQPLHSVTFESAVTALKYSPDGKQIAVGSVDGKSFVIDLAKLAAQPGNSHDTGSLKTRSFVHGAALSDFFFHPDGKRFITCSAKVIRVWDAKTGSEVVMPRRKFADNVLNHSGPTKKAGMGIDGDWLFTVRDDDRSFSTIWYIKNREESDWAFSVSHDKDLHHGHFHPLRRGILITGSEDGVIRKWDLNRGTRQVRNMETGDSGSKSIFHIEETSTMAGIKAMARDRAGVMFAVADTKGSIRFLDYGKLSKIDTVKIPELSDPDLEISNMLFSPDGQFLAIASSDGMLRILSVIKPADGHGRRLELSTEVRTGQTFDQTTLTPRLMKASEWQAKKAELIDMGGFCDRPK